MADSLTHPKKPCAECPWRRDVATGHFPPERYRALANTAYDMSMVMFACHKSLEGQETVCAGFLMRGAMHNLRIRLARSRGGIGLVSDGGYPLYENYVEMAVANGLDRGEFMLRRCRGNDD